MNTTSLIANNFKKITTNNGSMVSLNNETFYKISDSHTMRPFFMTIVSDSNHWMFISSNGALSAGRKNAQFALFPYYTDDKITALAETTGCKTIFRVHKNDRTYLWEPFSERNEGLYDFSRNIYKNVYGNKIIFEEINHDLNLVFSYEWNSSDVYGFVRKAKLVNTSSDKVSIEALDGFQDILPFGVGSELQANVSNLVDAYKKSELEKEIGLGIYSLSAIIVDKAEPSEALKATIVWSNGIEKPTYLLSSLQIDAFRKGFSIKEEIDIRAEKGAYLTVFNFILEGNSCKDWLHVANVNQSISQIVALSQFKATTKNIKEVLEKDILSGTKKLIKLTASADGLQLTADHLINTRHFSNTLFNIMRGGVFDNNYLIEKLDFLNYLSKANTNVYNSKREMLHKMPATFSVSFLKEFTENDLDKDFKRLSLEYLPLKFSRRHGDPSRPWNKFSINTKNENDGSKILDYEGNWRDIFQNWEALAHSYPGFIESMIHKFLNATTFDGYNPYRVTKGGFDWEVIEENDPWSYIGYWGDHQVIYLLKFLEFAEKHYPNELSKLFSSAIFVYANVPYKIKSYQEILKNSKDTIDFDFQLNEKINKEREYLGADGALLKSYDGAIYKVNLIEKILATLLAKVSNFIPEAGIWLNTQRPEWNDANNALVGNGVSMVTLYYLRRFIHFFEELVLKSSTLEFELSEELAVFFKNVHTTLLENKKILTRKFTNKERKLVLDGLAEPASNYRVKIYKNGFSTKKQSILKDELLTFLDTIKEYLEHSIKANKRADNLYHAYNLMTLKGTDEIEISYLPEMLEGQVAVLSAKYLSSKEALELLNGLKNSALFRPDQYSYILYPNKELPRFTHKNNIAKDKVESSLLLATLINDNNTNIIEKDVFGNYHFNGSFNNANSLENALDLLPKEKYSSLLNQDKDAVLAIFETVFNHKSFTGRSGTFFGYEGLGSIYWHMVSKLLVAVQENCIRAIEEKASDKIIGKLLDHYYEIHAGIGVHKSPRLYGAFPTDAYSHTPAGKGAQQPGMTGQVKEDVLNRFGELGVFVKEGKLFFNPSLLKKEEFLRSPQIFKYITVSGDEKELEVNQHELAFTYCQVPILYSKGEEKSITVIYNDHSSIVFSELFLSREVSNQVFKRTNTINHIKVVI
ncbi:hypothetical protein [Polaribacter tangerinus]|uniref:hypothetical protein n=1 Tax=Polaribacter tangerinus TaxID=1920034 RepID=UPI000B4C1243|nr:hypothetical protein [Polaribacter tangerinus]